MSLAPITLTFTLYVVFWGMLRVFTLMPASFPKLAKLLCLYRCPLFLCYTLVLSLLLLGVGFRFSLTSFWGCLKPVSHAFICFIGSFKPSMMRSNRLLIYPLTELFKIWWMNHYGSFFSCCFVGVCVIPKEVIQISERFLPTLRGLWWATGFFFRKSSLCFSCSLFPSFIGWLFNYLSSSMSYFG